MRATTDPASQDFVPPEERIAEFDQDGTLWVEHPVYTQVVFCLDRVAVAVKAKPQLKNASRSRRCSPATARRSRSSPCANFLKIVLATQSGMDVEAFREDVRKWLAVAKDPRWDRPYTELVYQPMIEVMNYMRANGYRTFIATGGSAGFVGEYSGGFTAFRPSKSPAASRRSNTATIGTTGRSSSGSPGWCSITSKPERSRTSLDVSGGPDAAFGNSSSDDQQMLEYAKAGSSARLSVAGAARRRKREYAYGPAQGLPNTTVGTFSQADVRHGQEAGLDRRQHEGRLEAHLRIRVASCCRPC